MDTKELLAEKLLTERKNRNLSQRQVANALGISEGQYAHYEKGRASPDVNMVYQICMFFNVSFDEWLGINKTAPPPASENAEKDSREQKLIEDFKRLALEQKKPRHL